MAGGGVLQAKGRGGVELCCVGMVGQLKRSTVHIRGDGVDRLTDRRGGAGAHCAVTACGFQ